LARAVAAWLAQQTVGVVVLGLLGGFVVGISWRASYLLGPVVAVVALAGCIRAVPEVRATDVGRFDLPGLVLVAIGLVSLLYGISNAASAGWVSAKVSVPIAIGIAALVGFAVREWNFSSPAFPIRLFSDPELQAATLSGVAFNIGNAVVAIQLSLLWQYVYRYTPFEVSLGQMPFVVASIFAATWAGSLLGHGARVRSLMSGGLLMLAVALAIMAFAGAATPIAMFVVPLLVAGVGLMLAQTPAANIFVAKSPPSLVGAIGSSRTAFGQFGFAFGLALSSSLLYGMFGPQLQERLEQAGATPAEQAMAVGILQSFVQTGSASQFDAKAVHEAVTGGIAAYLASYRITMLVMAGIIAAAAILSYLVLARGRATR
jgi:hypothetical protein